MPSPSLLTATGFDRAAIMSAAWDMARERQQEQARFGSVTKARDFLGSSIQIVWIFAREQAADRHLSAEKREALEAARTQLAIAEARNSLPAWKSGRDAAYRAIANAERGM
jgi:hypothetical protein